jgi:hypothetical protein
MQTGGHEESIPDVADFGGSGRRIITTKVAIEKNMAEPLLAGTEWK